MRGVQAIGGACLWVAALSGACTPDEGAGSEPGESEESSGDGDGDGDGDGVEPEVAWPLLDCDPLVPEYCGFPFPNNVFSVELPETATGRQLALSEALMPVGAEHQPALDLWLDSDGFSPASTMLAYFPGATREGLPTPLTIEASLAPDSPTVLLDAESGERIPHWAELDMSHGDDSRRAFMIRPAVRLEPARRYIVAVRGLVDAEGAALAPSEGFAALREGESHEDPAIEQRRGLYADIFARLAEAGVEREQLQLAWDFSTASEASLSAPLLHMRDEGLASFEAGPQLSITQVELDPAPGLAARVIGNLIVPLYLDDPGPGGRPSPGPDGLPEPLGMAEYPFLALVPSEAYQSPAGLVQFGHGLFGSYLDGDGELTRQLAVDHNYIVFGSTWTGMAGEDLGHIISILSQARIDDFDTVVGRLQQGVLNALAAMSAMRGGAFAAAPELLGPNAEPLLIDPARAYFFGASLGGIMGSVYMALSTEVERGALVVPGQPFSLLLNRSRAFVELSTLALLAYDDTLDVRFAYELMQILWDRAEPTGFTRHIIDDPLPGTPTHEVLLMTAIGDHLVTNLSSHVMARELAVPQISPVNRSVFGVDELSGPYEGSAWIEYDFGLPPIPLANVPMTEGSDPHGALAGVPNALTTAEQFLRTGVVESYCEGPCDPS